MTTTSLFAAGMPCTDNNTTWARRQVTSEPVPLRMIRGNCPRLVVIDLPDPHTFGRAIIPAARRSNQAMPHDGANVAGCGTS
ncbi:hypothetical protein AB0D98_03730 [Streptomyces sp. NPDC047987]|uniref:hypothetical protein n=1 Tax=unclassified Streptomyces TaxID=2593676 RepID=UPI00341D5BC7